MTIQRFGSLIHKDTAVYGSNVYLGNGQGCGTIWFKNISAARKALFKDGIKSGADLCNCKKCNCRYSVFDPRYEKHPAHICSNDKEDYARKFEQP